MAATPNTSAYAARGETTELLASAFDSCTAYALIVTDLDGRVVLWNEGATRTYGYRPGVWRDKSITVDQLHTEEDRALNLPAKARNTATREERWEDTLTQVRADGGEFIGRLVLTPRRAPTTREPVGFLLVAKDISDEVGVTEELEATQFYTRSLIESNIDALMTTDPLGIVTDVNSQMEWLTGHEREELIGTPFKRYFTEPDRAEEGIRRALRDGRNTNYELTARRKNGAKTVVSYNATTFYDSDGKLQGVFASARDITEYKALERRLRESQSYNRGLIEASVDGLITVEADGLISDVNDEMCEMSGRSRDELIGTEFADYFVDADRATRGVSETFERGVVTDYVLNLVRPDGVRVKVSFNASVFRDSDGEVAGIFASARDITEQARLQAQLVEERGYNRGLIEASLDGLITVDPLLDITDVNETMCRMSGYTRDELVGSPFQDYFTDPRRAGDGVRLTLDRGAVTNYELTLTTKDGAPSLVSFNASVFQNSDGQVAGIFASARDITEQARLQDRLADEQAYNRGLIEASVDGLVTVDERMVVTDVNETMCRMVGVPRNQLIGTSFLDHFAERELAAEGVRTTFTQGQVTNYVLTLNGADGSGLAVSFNAAVFRDTAGEVRGIFASARDITGQVELEQQLRDTESYTRSLIESNIDALMTTDPQGVITDVNQQMEALTGRSRDVLIGSEFKSHFTDPERAGQGIALVLRDERVTNYELTACSAQNQCTTVSYNASTFFDREGQLQGVFAAARDVTDQKALEQQLRHQQTYNRGLIESSADGLVTVDPEGYISDVNDRICVMTAYSRAELLGTRFADYFTEPDRAWAGVRRTFDEGSVTEYALTIVARTRRQLWVSFNASVFRDPEGQVRGILASARDVTDRVRLEEQLREQQTYLRGLIESSVDGLITVDPPGFITDVNEQMCRMSGFSRSELIGSPFKLYFTDVNLADSGVKRTLAEGVVTNYALVLRTSSGRKATVSFNASVFRSPDGIIQGIFASARDISEQSRLSHQLAAEQAYNRSLIEASADALFAIAPDGIVTDVNEEVMRLTGHTRKHLISSPFSEYFTDPQRALAGVQQTFDEGRVLDYELTLVTRHGRHITVSFNAGVFRDASGDSLGILASARDVTDQKALEQELRNQQDYTRSLIESNIDALMTTEPLGVITDVNQQMEALTGYSRAELIGSEFRRYFTRPEEAEEGIRLALQEGKVEHYELTARAKDGTRTEVSYNGTTIYDRDGKLQGVFAAARDVSEWKLFERRLQAQNVELEQANRAKDRFLATISHELRTPLNAILGFTGVLLMKLPGPLSDDQESQLNSVQNSAQHLLAIINDLLDLAKIESGKVELSPQDVVCEGVVREVADNLRPLAARKGLELRVPDAGPSITVHTDRRLLHQVLINLANNAIKFTESGMIELRVLRDPRGVVLEVADTGPGIPPDQAQRLFEAFERLRPAADGQEGSGLGLHISRRLAELLGGQLDVRSEVGSGSTFSLVLPDTGLPTAGAER